MPKEPFKDIQFVFVDNMRQVFREALKEKVPTPVIGRLPSGPPAAGSQWAKYLGALDRLAALIPSNNFVSNQLNPRIYLRLGTG